MNRASSRTDPESLEAVFSDMVVPLNSCKTSRFHGLPSPPPIPTAHFPIDFPELPRPSPLQPLKVSHPGLLPTHHPIYAKHALPEGGTLIVFVILFLPVSNPHHPQLEGGKLT